MGVLLYVANTHPVCSVEVLSHGGEAEASIMTLSVSTYTILQFVFS